MVLQKRVLPQLCRRNQTNYRLAKGVSGATPPEPVEGKVVPDMPSVNVCREDNP